MLVSQCRCNGIFRYIFMFCLPLLAFQRGVQLEVQESAEQSHTLPSTKLYHGYLINQSASVLRLEAIRMPGGFAGGGMFFNCRIETRNSSNREWSHSSEFRPKNFDLRSTVTIVVAPGDRKEVCREMLPSHQSSGGCMRFSVASSWRESADRWFSRPFFVRPTGEMAECR